MTKRACVDDSFTIAPFPWAPRREPKVWTGKLDVKESHCRCSLATCFDSCRLYGLDRHAVITASSRHFCRVFEQGDTINSRLTILGSDGTIQFQKAYIPDANDYQLVIYLVPLNGKLNERQQKEYDMRASQKRSHEIQCYTFVHCVLYRLGFYRDLRNCIARRVFC